MELLYINLDRGLRLTGDRGGQIALDASSVIPGGRMKTPEKVVLRISSSGSPAAFWGDRTLIMFAGEEPVYYAEAPLPVVTHDGEDWPVETVTVEVPYRSFVLLAEIGGAKMMLGPMRVTVGWEQLKVLRGLRDCVERGRCE